MVGTFFVCIKLVAYVSGQKWLQIIYYKIVADMKVNKKLFRRNHTDNLVICELLHTFASDKSTKWNLI